MQFENPMFLLGLLAVLIPILVHLFNFRRYKKVYFSNVEFLRQLQNETKKQSQLKHWLVLAARILTITFLVLAFAKPFFQNADSVIKSGTNYVSVYIDNSFSMESTSSERGTLLDEAKQKAKEIVDAYKPSDKFCLLTNDVEGKHFRFVSPDDFKTLVDEVAVSSMSGTLSSMVKKQHEFLKKNTSENKTSYVLSDFQQSFSDFENVSQLDTQLTTVFLPLKSEQVNNIFIDSVSLSSPIFHKGSNVVLTVYLKNAGDELVEKVPLKLYINDVQRALMAVDLQPNSEQAVSMNFVVDNTGILNGKVVLTDYPITFDDEMYFTLNVADRIKILSINGKEKNNYLSILFGQDSAFVYENIAASSVDFDNINSYNVVVANELKDLPSGLVQTLSDFVEKGGSLVLLPSLDMDLASYENASRYWKTPIYTALQERNQMGVALNMENILYSNVFEKKEKDIEMPNVTKYFAAQQDSKTIKESLITLENGDDFLAVTSLGNGKIYMFSTPLRTATTDFVKQALFVPTLYNMALYSVKPQEVYTLIDDNIPIALSTSFSANEVVASMVSLNGDNEFIPEITTRNGKAYLQTYGQIKQADNYLLKQGRGEAIEGLSFNYNRTESVMEFLEHSDIEDFIKNYNLISCKVFYAMDKPMETYLSGDSKGFPLWKIFIILSLAMLLAEILLVRLPFSKTKSKVDNN